MEWQCTADPKAYLNVEWNGEQIFIDCREGDIFAGIYATKKDAAEIGRYLIQLSGDGE